MLSRRSVPVLLAALLMGGVPSDECRIHWTDDTTNDEWKDFFGCADDLYEDCDRVVQIKRENHDDQVDPVVFPPPSCDPIPWTT